MNHRTYVVIPRSVILPDLDPDLDPDEVPENRFEKVMETSESTLRWSVDGTKTFVKFVGDTPDFLAGLTSRNHDEIRTLLATSEWSNPDPE